jgi:DNA-binding MarR family transcriptional regulator
MTEAADVPTLARDIRALVGTLRRRLREQAATDDFTPSQTSVLSLLLSGEKYTVTTLAQAEGVRTQSMGATVAVLLDAGVVEGHPDPDDGRRTLLTLTNDARERFLANRTAKEDWLVRAASAEFTPAELLELEVGVRLLKRLVAEPAKTNLTKEEK